MEMFHWKFQVNDFSEPSPFHWVPPLYDVTSESKSGKMTKIKKKMIGLKNYVLMMTIMVSVKKTPYLKLYLCKSVYLGLSVNKSSLSMSTVSSLFYLFQLISLIWVATSVVYQKWYRVNFLDFFESVVLGWLGVST